MLFARCAILYENFKPSNQFTTFFFLTFPIISLFRIQNISISGSTIIDWSIWLRTWSPTSYEIWKSKHFTSSINLQRKSNHFKCFYSDFVDTPFAHKIWTLCMNILNENQIERTMPISSVTKWKSFDRKNCVAIRAVERFIASAMPISIFPFHSAYRVQKRFKSIDQNHKKTTKIQDIDKYTWLFHFGFLCFRFAHFSSQITDFSLFIKP